MNYPSQNQLLKILDYNPSTGTLIWKINKGPRAKIGMIAGTNLNGYRTIKIDGKLLYAHIIIWIMMMGESPKNTVDHINRIRDDNRWENLREATQAQQTYNISIHSNNTSGIPGVGWSKTLQKWQAYISINRKQLHLGYFDVIEEAIAIRKSAEQQYFGEFQPNL